MDPTSIARLGYTPIHINTSVLLLLFTGQNIPTGFYTDYETYVFFASPHSIVAMVIIREQAGVILKRTGLLPLKGYLMFLAITNQFYF